MRYIALLTALACAQAQPINVIWQENFNSTPAGGTPTGWNLSATNPDGSASITGNRWRVDARYGQQCCDFFGCLPSLSFQANIPNQPPGITGSPQSGFLYITSSNCPLGTPSPTNPALFDGQSIGSSFATTPNIPISAGSAPIKVSFWWLCGYADDGNGLSAYGRVYYSTDGGNTWIQATSRSGSPQFSNQTNNWYPDTFTVSPRPTQLRIGFQFSNTGSAISASQPGFIIDDVKVFEEVSVSAPTISITSVTPSPACAGGQLQVSFTHSGFSGSPNFQAELLDAGNNVVFTSAASTTSPITFTVPASLASGNYSVRVVSGSTQSATQPIQVINLSSFTCAANVTSVVAGNPVTFTLNGGAGFPTSGSLSVTFDPGDGNPPFNLGPYALPGGLPANHSYTYTTPGSYAAQFIASLGGCTYTCTQNITVTATPTFTLDNLSHTQVCAGGSVQVSYTAAGFPPGTQYTAQLLSGSTVIASASGASPITLTVPPTTPTGTYTVRIQANTNPPTNSNTLTLDVLNLSAFTLTCSANPTTANAGTSITLTANLTPAPPLPVTVQMNPGDGSAVQSAGPTTTFPQNFTHTYALGGTYTVTFTVSYPAPGCTLTCTQTVTINPVITLGTVASSVCAGSSLSVPFTAAGFPSGTTFTAQLLNSSNAVVASGTGTSSPISISIPTTLPSGTYTVQVVSGSTQSGTAAVSVVNLSGLTCNASATTIQPGQTVTFTLGGTNLPSTGTLTGTFNPGDGSGTQNLNYTLPTGLPATIAHTYTAGGSYTATFTVSYGGCTRTCTQTIEVREITLVSANTTVCTGGNLDVEFTAAGFPAGTTFTAQLLNSSNAVVASGTGTSSPISISIPTTLPSGTYTVQVVSGSTQSGTATVEVVNLSGIVCTVSPTTVQAGQTVTFVINGTNLPSSGTLNVVLNPGDGSNNQVFTYTLPSGLPATITYTYTTPGSYTAIFGYYYGSCSESCIASVTVTAPAAPQLVIGDISSPICAGGGITVPFYAVGFPPNTTYTVEIAPSGSSTWTPLCSGTNSPISCTTDPQIAGGSYSVRISAGTPAVYSQTRSLEIVQMNDLTCTLSPVPAYVNETVTLTLSGSNLPSGPFSVEWLPDLSLPAQAQTVASLPTNLTYTYTTAGIYYGRVTVTHVPSGCQGRCELPIAILTRSTGGDPTSLIFISPDGNTLLLHGVNRVEIFDALGRTVYVGDGSQSISVMRGGLYFLRLWVGDRVEVQRLYLP